jgi:hypothetical protein
VAGCCECGDEPSGSCTTELVNYGNIVSLTYEYSRDSSTELQLHPVALSHQSNLILYFHADSNVSFLSCIQTGNS